MPVRRGLTGPRTDASFYTRCGVQLLDLAQRHREIVFPFVGVDHIELKITGRCRRDWRAARWTWLMCPSRPSPGPRRPGRCGPHRAGYGPALPFGPVRAGNLQLPIFSAGNLATQRIEPGCFFFFLTEMAPRLERAGPGRPQIRGAGPGAGRWQREQARRCDQAVNPVENPYSPSGGGDHASLPPFHGAAGQPAVPCRRRQTPPADHLSLPPQY